MKAERGSIVDGENTMLLERGGKEREERWCSCSGAVGTSRVHGAATAVFMSCGYNVE